MPSSSLTTDTQAKFFTVTGLWPCCCYRRKEVINQRAAVHIQVSVSETLVWRAVDLLRRLDLGRLADATTGDNTRTSSDVPVQVRFSCPKPAGAARFSGMQCKGQCPSVRLQPSSDGPLPQHRAASLDGSWPPRI